MDTLYLRMSNCRFCTSDFKKEAKCRWIVMVLRSIVTLITVFPMCWFFIIVPIILVIDLDIQIKHKYHVDLCTCSFIGDPGKDMHFCGIVAHRKHSKHCVFTFKDIFSHINSNMWSEITRARMPFSLKYAWNRGNLIS